MLAALSLAIALALTACAGEGLEDTSTTTTTLATSSSLAEIQSNIFAPKCATSPGCHNSVGLAPKLSSTSQSYDQLVGVAATGCADETFVVAGNSATSYLLDKLGSGGSYCGSLMPLSSTALSSAELALITAWIDAGAPAASSKRQTVTTTSTSSTTTVNSEYWKD